MIATTLKQSRELSSLGIDSDTADMHYAFTVTGGSAFQDMIDGAAILLPGKRNTRYPYEPAWSLDALLELTPRSITSEKNGQTYLSFHRGYEDNWMIEYSFDDIDMDYLEVKFEQKNPVDAAFEMVVWLKENKYI